MSDTDVRSTIVALLRERPDLSGAEIGRRVRRSRQRVAQIADEEETPLNTRRSRPRASAAEPKPVRRPPSVGRFEVLSRDARNLACRIDQETLDLVHSAYGRWIAANPDGTMSDFLRQALVEKASATA